MKRLWTKFTRLFYFRTMYGRDFKVSVMGILIQDPGNIKVDSND